MARWKPSRRCRSEDTVRLKGMASSARPRPDLCSTGCIEPGDADPLGTATFELRGESSPSRICSPMVSALRRVSWFRSKGLRPPAWSSRAALSSMATRCRLARGSRAKPTLAIRDAAQARISRGRLDDPHQDQRRAVADGQYRAVLAVPDAGRADRPDRWRCRRRQCGARLSRRQARRHCHVQIARRPGGFVITRLSDPDPDHRLDRHRHRPRARRPDSFCCAARVACGLPIAAAGRLLSRRARLGRPVWPS